MTRRYPLADLVELLRLSADDIDRTTSKDVTRSHRPSDNQARTMLAVGGTTWRNYRNDGLTAPQAERLAERAGFHPAEIWPTWYDDEFAELAAPCAECGDLFIPNLERRQRFCSRRCGTAGPSRTYHNTRYQTDPDYAERKREQQRERYAAIRSDPAAWEREKAGERVRKRKMRERRREASQ